MRPHALHGLQVPPGRASKQDGGSAAVGNGRGESRLRLRPYPGFAVAISGQVLGGGFFRVLGSLGSGFFKGLDKCCLG